MIRTNKPKDNYVGKQVRISYCWCKSPNYNNLTPKSVHTIIEAPDPFENNERGVWVKGSTGDPVRIFTHEFEYKNSKFSRTK